ncbi:MAG: metallophosphoesterase, partial [Bdellovibrionia bacterium]
LPRFKEDIAANNIKFFVVLGDLTEDGTSEEYRVVKSALEGVGIPYYATIGNHDLFQDSSAGGWGTWKSTFGPATYSVVVSNAVRFIFLDTASGDIGANQFLWLKAQLLTKVPFTFVGSHYPIYDGITPIMWRLASLEERYKLTSVLDEGGVYAYISGHIHGYRENQVASFKHFIAGSMFPYELDYGPHGYLLFTYDHGQMTWKHVIWDDII